MTEMVTLTLTGAKRFMISGTQHTVEKWDQVNVDSKTAEHLLDQYFVDGNNVEQPFFEEGVVKKPEPRADRKRIRASQRRLDREAAKAADDAENMQAFRQDAKAPQDPYNRSRNAADNPDWAVNTDVQIGPASKKADTRVFEDPEPAPVAKMEAPKKAPAKRKRTARKTKAKE
jgi:hypothetical protein